MGRLPYCVIRQGDTVTFFDIGTFLHIKSFVHMYFKAMFNNVTIMRNVYVKRNSQMVRIYRIFFPSFQVEVPSRVQFHLSEFQRIHR